MEVMLRCSVPDRPGALASLAGTIADAGGDIQAVEVIESGEGAALDDLVVIVEDPAQLERLLTALRTLEGLAVIHAGPSRGHPGDAVTRLAVGFESLVNGAMTLENGLERCSGECCGPPPSGWCQSPRRVRRVTTSSSSRSTHGQWSSPVTTASPARNGNGPRPSCERRSKRPGPAADHQRSGRVPMSDEITAAEERRAAEEALIAERNAAQKAAEADGSDERVLLLPPEGYAVPPGDDPE